MLTSFNLPKTKLSGLKICPKGPDRTESIVPGSKSTNTARGTYFPPENKERKIIVGEREKASQPNFFGLRTSCFVVVNVYSF